MLLENGADINAEGGLSGRSALQEASDKRHSQIVRMLPEKGARYPETEFTSQQEASEQGEEDEEET
jgi:hypothetical protein